MDSGSLLRKVPFLSNARNDRLRGNPGKLLARLSAPNSERNSETAGALIFSREDVWDGLRSDAGGKVRHLCNGLINDWINWQNTPAMSPLRTLERVLRHLSPPDISYGDLEILKPGRPARIPGESRLIPTIAHPYGDIPLIHASASVRRIVTMAKRDAQPILLINHP